MKRIGIRDVAEAAGVSVTTVSHALSGQGNMTAETRDKVRAVAAGLGYQPNRMAKSLRSQRSGVIGLINDRVATTPFAGRILLGAHEAATRHGVMLMTASSDGEPDVEAREVETLRSYQVDGIIYASMFHRLIDLPRGLDGIPVVVVDAVTREPGPPCIVPDEFEIGRSAAQVLIDAGHTRLVHLTIRDDVPAQRGRMAGFLAALEDAGLEGGADRVAYSNSTAQTAHDDMASYLARGGDATGVVCFNDQMAMGVYSAAAEAGLRIPQDLSVVGVDNLELIAAALRPALTTVELPHYEMGRWAVDAVMSLLRAEGAPIAPVTQQRCAVIERGSVSAPLA